MQFLTDNFISVFFINIIGWTRSLLGITDPAWSMVVAIVVFTAIIRLVLIPVDIINRKQTVKMARLQPKMAELKERYKDPQVLNQKTRELNKKAKYNPLAGCLPMLLQLVIFFAFFGALSAIANAENMKHIVSIGTDVLTNGAEAAKQTTQLQGWLWVHNFWQPDSGISPVMPDLNSYSNTFNSINILTSETKAALATVGGWGSNVGLTPAVLESARLLGAGVPNVIAYQQVWDVATVNYQKVMNGWFILPVLSAAVSFFQAWLTNKQNPSAMAQQGGKQGKMMIYLMPLLFIVFTISAPTSFAFYYFISSLLSLVVYLILSKAIKLHPPEDEEGELVMAAPAGKGAAAQDKPIYAKAEYKSENLNSIPEKKANIPQNQRKRKKGKRAH